MHLNKQLVTLIRYYSTSLAKPPRTAKKDTFSVLDGHAKSQRMIDSAVCIQIFESIA